MFNLFNTLKSIYNHPFNKDNKIGAVLKFAKWQIFSRVFNYKVIYPFSEKTRLIVWNGLTGATGNIYCGLLEYEDMSFLLHFLKKDDLFIDIGSNVGVYSILASGECESNCIAIEPIPSTYRNLVENIIINNLSQKIKALNIGLGETDGKLHFSSSLDTMNFVLKDKSIDSIEIDVYKLDKIIENEKVPSLIKIDVEGYETAVLNGAENLLLKSELNAIIIELNGMGKRYGYDDNMIHNKLLNHGFAPYSYNPENRSIKKLDKYGKLNTIYLRDISKVKERIETAISKGIGPQNKMI